MSDDQSASDGRSGSVQKDRHANFAVGCRIGRSRSDVKVNWFTRPTHDFEASGLDWEITRSRDAYAARRFDFVSRGLARRHNSGRWCWRWMLDILRLRCAGNQ